MLVILNFPFEYNILYYRSMKADDITTWIENCVNIEVKNGFDAYVAEEMSSSNSTSSLISSKTDST